MKKEIILYGEKYTEEIDENGNLYLKGYDEECKMEVILRFTNNKEINDKAIKEVGEVMQRVLL